MNQRTNFSTSDKDKMGSSSSEGQKGMSGTSTSGMSGQSSQSGGFSQQSYTTQQPYQTYDYMKTQVEEGSNQPIEKLIIADHYLVRSIYDKFKSALSKDDAEKWRNELIYEIARHSIAEELILYPVMREKFPDGENLFQTSISEHKEVKKDLYDCQNTDVSSSDFKTKVRIVMEALIKHIEKEESEILPMLCKYIPEDQRISLGTSFSRRKLIVPTRPHTMVPEDPPTLNSLLGLLTAPIDKFRDLFSAFPDQEKMAEMKKESTQRSQTSGTSGGISSSGKGQQ